MPYDPNSADPRALGERLRAYIKASGKTQAKVAEEIGVDPTYVSQMVNGRVNWVKSDYFRRLSQVLRLSIVDIQELNPDLFLGNLDRHPGGILDVRIETPDYEISNSLKEAIDQYGGRFPKLREPRWQRWLASTEFRDEPETPEDWLAVFLDFEKKINPR